MSLRFASLVVFLMVIAVAVVGCGVRNEGGAVSENVLTAELVVPPGSQEVAATATEVATATPVPTATVEVVEVLVDEEVAATVVEEVIQEVVEEVVEEKARVNVPNRGYNSYGDADAPITMFDFSDFL